ncbi:MULTISPECIES: SRPBCC family protein [unclassified Mycobacterium]|uniref:SRPBCC family protein n=1 Tax=unclassified Mycobacterium TaxID=2642494 RepID=UPI00073FAC3B|nr:MULTISPECIES: SRPBCC family protein [unclassified Mycobacterium]KUH81433.1 cyclase [Mycobacterium sp. GA-0227b]KUH83563.1 cyclase [Mycobacterium sp. GA-1999]
MAEIDRSRVIAATPTQIWDVLADFGDLASWLDKVDHSCILTRGADGAMVGTTRRVQIGRNTLVERITECDPQYVLAYDIEGLPKVLGNAGNRWTIEATGGGETVVTITSTVRKGRGRTQQLVERLACQALARGSDAMLAALAKRLEKTS